MPLNVLGSDSGTEACSCGGEGCGCSAGAEAPAAPALELAQIREKEGRKRASLSPRERGRGIEGKGGDPKKLWRSLEELAGTPGFEEMLHREFPRFASEWVETGAPEGADGGLSRRRFLQLSSASVALAGLTACTRQPPESIVPYVRQPEEVVPGRPLYFATAFAMGGYAQGILVESHTGRPTKVEGNPEHPANPGGGTDAFAQASILQLYDPDRSGVLDYLGQIRTWQDFQRDLAPRLRALRALGGAGLRILTGTVTSPTLAAQLEALLEALPEARWYQWEPAGRHNVHRGAVRAFGHPVETRYDLSRADAIVALDSDFLTQGPGAVRAAHEWAGRRRAPGPDGASAAVSRLYALESMPSNTGSVADHRLAARPSEIARFALALAAELGVAGAEPVALDGEAGRWLPAVAADLRAHPGRALVVAGDGAPPAVHVLAHAINHALAAVGSTVRYTEPAAARPDDQVAGIRALAAELHAGEVDTLLILGANPAFDAPADLDLAAALPQAGLRVHVGLYKDETSQYCQWHVPQAHFLESWGDARAADGTVSIVQPLIEPLYQGRSFHEVLSQLTDRTDATARELVRERWRDQLADERAWRRALHDGFVPETALPEVGVSAGGVEEAAADVRVLSIAAGGAVEVAFSPDPAVWDGSWANNAWLQELPRPATRLTWDNAVLMSPATARELGVAGIGADLVHRRPRVRVTVGERSLELPAWVVPGHADGAVTLHFGQGRRRAGKVAEGAGFDLYPLRTSDGLWLARGELAVAGGTYPMATTQDHHSMEGRHLVRTGTLAGYLEDPEIIRRQGHDVPEASFFPEWKYDGYAWGMAVDLNVCTGCSACVIACQSENNIPVVGKEQVARGREMHWLRIDRYFEGPDAEEVSAIHHQPVLCMQCEKAPCEVVCPVAATVHSSEGLNDMVYNRCVGTRYCSNNCPYKVRRFNFLKYTDHETEVLKLGRNPDVTVRQRGVMEKCTYCVQRINHARIEAKVAGQRNPSDGGGEGRIPRDSIRTACQQACPSGALVFGDINDPDSEVSRRKAEPLGYALLEELGTKPRTTYLAKLRNPNPALEPPAAATGSRHGGH